MTPEVVGQITHDANEKAAQIRMLSRPGEPDFFGNQFAAVSLTFALELLGLYHASLKKTQEEQYRKDS